MEKVLTTNLDQRIASLSPAKRALLERYLQEKMVPAKPAVSIPQRDTTTLPPLSFAQQRLWFLDQLQPGMTAYNSPATYRLRGTLNRSALQQALTEILRRHESQRTTVGVSNGEPYQIINPPVEFPLPIKDLRGLPADQWDATIQEHVFAESTVPFNLAHDLMRRARLLCFGEQEHVLIVTSHHIASDGWSSGVFWHELTTLYAAFVQAQPSPLPPLPIQYADYAVWLQQWQQSAAAKAQLAYWQTQLAGAPPLLELPTDRPRPVVQSFQGAEYNFTFSTTLIDALKALGRQENATLFMTLLTGFTLVLQRYTGQDDLLVGAPIAGRNQPELEGMLGFFLNNLVLRTRLTDAMSARAVLKQVRTTTLAAYANQMLPFEKLLEALRPERSLSHTALFQLMFILQNTPSREFTLTGLQLERLTFDTGATKFDMTVSLTEQAAGVRGTLRYRTDLFDQSTIARLVGHYQTLLEQMVYNPDCAIAELSLSSAAEQTQLLVTWNQTTANFAPALHIVQRLQSVAKRTPAATAFICQQQCLTFQELNLRANQLAHYLQTLGIKPGMRVGICLERSFDVPISVLAIFKVGGVYVPLDPSHPSARLAHIIADADIAVIITQTEWRTKLSDAGASTSLTSVRLLCLDEMAATLATQAAANSTITPALDSPAYILFTSGSTGQPKGVIVPYRYVHNRLNWTWQTYPLQPHECGCQSTSFNFTDSIWEMFGYLLQGLPTVIVADSLIRDGNLFVRSLAEHNVTRLWLTPSLLRLLLDIYPDLQQRLPALKFWVTTGELLTYDLVQRFQTVLPHATIYNHYGTTEASNTAWWDSSKAHDLGTDGAKAVPIGRPTANVRTYILDKQLRPVPLGLRGELHVGGDNLACGYLNQPALTAERFIADPFSSEPGARLYKTGDLARYLPDGQMEIYGRTDFQVKLRGFRIELGEIEDVLNQHTAVRQSVVIMGENDAGNKQLVAYVVFKVGAEATLQALKQYVIAQLPGYMVPAVIVPLDALPLTSSGKVDRRALPAPMLPQSQHTQATTWATDALERHLCQIWQGVLKVQSIGVHDNFFDLGGHSLLAVQLFEQIATLTGQRLPVATLFQAPTVAQLADCLRQQDWTPPWQALVPVQSGGNKPLLFVAPPAASTVLRYAAITRHLAPDQPVYGLQYLGFEPGEEPPQTMEAMAAYYVEQICTLQPTGPYFLVGICFGGHLMFEVAQQLQAQSKTVALTLIIDTAGPDNGPGWARPQRHSRKHLYSIVEHWHQKGFWSWVRGHLVHRAKLIRHKRNPHRSPRLEAAHQKVRTHYQAAYYTGRVHLVQSQEYAQRPLIRTRWAALSIGPFDYTVIPGSTHHSLLFHAEHAQWVAARITELLQQTIEQES